MPLYTPIKNKDEFQARILLRGRGEGRATPEDEVVEFKKEQHRNPSELREIARDVAQFANTDGGNLIIGVSEVKDPDTDAQVADKIIPIKGVGQLEDWITDALAMYLSPVGCRVTMAAFKPWGEGPVLVLNVEPSDRMIAVWTSQVQKQHEGIEYVYRTAKGKAWFSPEQAAMRLNNWSSRAVRIRIADILASGNGRTRPREVDIMPPLCMHQPRSPATFGRIRPCERDLWVKLGVLGPDEFALHVMVADGASEATLSIPYQYVNFAWRQEDGGLGLDLNVTLVNRRDAWDLYRTGDPVW